MAATEIEIGEVKVSITVRREHAHRTERIAQLALEYVREQLSAGSATQPRASPAEVECLEVSAVGVRFDLMTDEMIARQSAAEIHRALRAALGA